MRVCIEKSTGKLIESQSGGEVEYLPQDEKVSDIEYAEYLAKCDALESMRLNTLKQNAINAGYLEADIEVKFVTDAEFETIMEVMKPIPTYEDLRRAEYPKTDDLLVALWEHVIEGRPESATILQAKREAVKIKYSI